MKIIKGLAIIFTFLFFGKLVSIYIPLALPSNIIGMVLLFLALNFNIVDIDDLSKIGDILLDNLVFLFIPIGVGIIQYKNIILNELYSIIIIGIGGFLLLFLCTGKIVDEIQKRREQENCN
ncbi:MAG: CidA/LrgA family protein [Halothermotrichaceae bacterium]